MSSNRTIDTLAELVRINSVNPNYDGGVPEQAIADYVQRFFAKRNIETWRQICYPNRPNVIARLPGRDSSRRIVLEAHLDTVSTGGMTGDPFAAEIRAGKLYGRGACDTKGPMAAMMHAVASLASTDFEPAVDVIFAATIDEEFSYRGVVALCHGLDAGEVDANVLRGESRSGARLRADAAIVAEPTSLRPVISSKGLVRFKIETRGKSAHSSKPHLGINAIDHMAELLVAIRRDTEELAQQSHPLLGPATCNVGVIRGGTQINFVADRCEIEIDRRILPGETHDGVVAHYQQLVDSVADRTAGMQATILPPLLTDLPLDTSPDCQAVQRFQEILPDFELDPTPIGVPFCSDASKFGALGIPSVIFGPGSIDQAHAAVEYIECKQVIVAEEIYRRFLLEFE